MNTTKQILNWRTSVTVAAVIARFKSQPDIILSPEMLKIYSLEQRQHLLEFLMIEEQTRDGVLINQPAGHLEADESPLQASIRETMEETAYDFMPQYFLGTYLCKALSQKDQATVSYLRLAFAGHTTHCTHAPLDDGILQAFWLDFEQIKNQKSRLRSPLVWICIEDYLNLKRYDLDMVYTDNSVYL
jgi:8-oxo-dGTP pyrophosphatase MutT (NUDIX family)